MESLRLWEDREIITMLQMVDCLRRMRTAATVEDLPMRLRVRNAICRVMGKDICTKEEPRQTLAEAEKLADSAGAFFATKLFGSVEANMKREKWYDTLARCLSRYESYTTTSFAQTSAMVAGTSLIGRLRNLSIDPHHMLRWELTENNHLGSQKIYGIADQNVAVVAPLSNDYLLATTYSQFIRLQHGKSFSTHAVALSRDLNGMVVPADFDSVLQECDSVGIYVDSSETGRTAEAVHKALSRVLGDKKPIHLPNGTPTEFVQSQKMKDFWSRYNTEVYRAP